MKKKVNFKLLTRLFALALALVITAMPVNAKAAGDKTITILNPTTDHEYVAYKLFDATVSSDKKLSYTVDDSAANATWIGLLNGTESPFQLTLAGDKYYVSLKTNTDPDYNADEAVITWLKNIKMSTVLTPAASVTPGLNSENVKVPAKLTNLEAGYYYITSTLGTLITLTTASEDKDIIDKNQKPGWDPEDPDEPDNHDPYDPTDPEKPETGKFVSNDGTTWVKENFAEIGSTLKFKINAYVPKYEGEDKVTEYTFNDIVPTQMTLCNTTDIKVYLNGDELTNPAAVVSATDDGFKVTIPVGDSYPAEAHVSICYTAKVNDTMVSAAVNTAQMSWKVASDPTNPHKVPDTSTTTKTLGIEINKVDAESKETIDGATFQLYTYDEETKTKGDLLSLVKNSGDGYHLKKADETATSVDEFMAGNVKIYGMPAGSYCLTEVSAPAGYNPLTVDRVVTITEADYKADGVAATATIENKKGATLPSTGGIGTTIFYIVGGILVLGAAVLLITKKRMSNVEE